LLEPEGRQLLLDALRPPPGQELDYAVGTTFSLDLMSLLAAPLGFALFDREASDGRLIADPIALVEAVRRYADRIDIFCQAGQIAIPREHRIIVNYLESSVHEVVPPLSLDAIFHPKVWVIRYSGADGGPPSYRLLCLSRNLTFDRSWDTVLRLDGEVQTAGSGDPRLSELIRRLPGLSELAHRRMSEQRARAVHQLADDLDSVVFAPPEGFDRLAFWPLGLDDRVWPFQGRIDRLLVVSPFLTAGCLARLAPKATHNVIVSRPEAFDLLGGAALNRFAETMVISPAALSHEATDSDSTNAEPGVATHEAIAERAGVELRGLHAKLYVADAGWRARIWTGSANATDAAFGGNVELLVELEGPRARCGIDAAAGERTDGVGLRKLLEPYRPASDAPRELTPTENLERGLDALRRRIARLRFVATISPADEDTYQCVLEISSGTEAPVGWWEAQLEHATLRCRPLSFGAEYLRPPTVDGREITVDFGAISFERLTSFFVVEMDLAEGDARATTAFVVNATLVGAPEDRRERTLVAMLNNGRDLTRLLLLLLGQIGADDLGGAVDVLTGDRAPQGTAWLSAEWQALFEPMVRALAVDPVRLDEINRLIAGLSTTPEGRRLLPTGWRDVWEPIWQARQQIGAGVSNN
jgi:hypothetical protein